MKEELKVNLNDAKLYEFDDVVEVKRNVDVGSHIPQNVIGKGLEFTKIREIENEELSKLWLEFNRTLKNSFIHLADEDGLNAYERLIDDESIKNGAELKRKIIYSIWNMKGIWTHRTLEEWLDNYLGIGQYSIELNYNDYGFCLDVIHNYINNDFNKLYSFLRYKILPANLTIELRLKINENLILQDKTNTYTNPFYPVGHIHKCGTVFRHQYVGKKLVNNINLKNAGAGRKQRQFNAGEIKAGGVKDDTK